MRTKRMVEELTEKVDLLVANFQALQAAVFEVRKRVDKSKPLELIEEVKNLRSIVVSMAMHVGMLASPDRRKQVGSHVAEWEVKPPPGDDGVNATTDGTTVFTSGRTIKPKKTDPTKKIKTGRKNGGRKPYGVPIDTNKLRLLMKYRGWKTPELAIRAGLHESMVYKYINGRGLPTVKSLLKLCEALETTPSNLRVG